MSINHVSPYIYLPSMSDNCYNLMLDALKDCVQDKLPLKNILGGGKVNVGRVEKVYIF